MKIFLYILSIIISLNTYAINAEEQLKKELNAIKTMTANFYQVVTSKDKDVSKSRGKMALLRPGKFLWKTTNPMLQTVVADGKKLWVYDVDLEQVTVKKQGNSLGGTAGLFLSGFDDKASRDFAVTSKDKGNIIEFLLKSKSEDNNFHQVIMQFSKHELVKLSLFDNLGQRTDIRFKNVKLNPKLKSGVFDFVVPKGVDVVEQ